MQRIESPGTIRVVIDASGGVVVTADGDVVLEVCAARVVVADDPVRGLEIVHDAGDLSTKYVDVDGARVYRSYADYASS